MGNDLTLTIGVKMEKETIYKNTIYSEVNSIITLLKDEQKDNYSKDEVLTLVRQIQDKVWFTPRAN